MVPFLLLSPSLFTGGLLCLLLGYPQLPPSGRVGAGLLGPFLAVGECFVSTKGFPVPCTLLGLPLLVPRVCRRACRAAAASRCICGLWTVSHFLPIRY